MISNAFIAQLFNFVLLVLVLRKLLRRPLLTTLEHRRRQMQAQIAQSQRSFNEAKAALGTAKTDLARLDKEMSSLKERSRAAAKQLAANTLKQAEEQAERMRRDADSAIAHAREALERDLQQAVAEAVVAGAEHQLLHGLRPGIQRQAVAEHNRDLLTLLRSCRDKLTQGRGQPGTMRTSS